MWVRRSRIRSPGHRDPGQPCKAACCSPKPAAIPGSCARHSTARRRSFAKPRRRRVAPDDDGPTAAKGFPVFAVD